MIKGFFALLIIGVFAAILYYTPTHHRAGTGTYYLSDYVSFTTPNGVIGWTPGQEVREVIRAPFVEGSRTVTDGAYTALIPETALTQDMEDSEAMELADNASQGQVRDNIAAAKAHYDKVQHTAMIAAAQDITRVNAQQVIDSRVGLYATRLNEPTRRLGGSYSTVYYGYPVHDRTSPATSTNGALAVSPLAQTSGGTYNPAVQHLNVPASGQYPNVSASPTPYPGGIAR